MNRERKYAEYTALNAIYLALSHNKPIIINVLGEPLWLIDEYNFGHFILDKFLFENSYKKDMKHLYIISIALKIIICDPLLRKIKVKFCDNYLWTRLEKKEYYSIIW